MDETSDVEDLNDCGPVLLLRENLLINDKVKRFVRRNRGKVVYFGLVVPLEEGLRDQKVHDWPEELALGREVMLGGRVEAFELGFELLKRVISDLLGFSNGFTMSSLMKP